MLVASPAFVAQPFAAQHGGPVRAPLGKVPEQSAGPGPRGVAGVTLAIATAALARSSRNPARKPKRAVLHASEDGASRRGLFGAVAAGSLLASAPALAAEKLATQLEVSGLGGKRGKQLNGLWSVYPDKRVNDRAVFKKDDQEIYLTYNNCQQFQMAKKPTGECEGFALETKGVWEVDGYDSPSMKLKPVKAQAPGEAGGAAKAGMLQLPSFSFGGSSTEEDEGYVPPKIEADETGSFQYAGIFKLDPGDAKIADSLESKLLARK
eukprot:CAMPEP_0181451044 /NCGR_PEP_ID=MMETSP1110-20121109/28487_1 /TAXON_ID=174948 /ORGANISM="Symbiodinium sp., Strain CCMP421" /LENGTH=264 /DNA_ID=CAMNT_0023575281 /DNA_START=53 /DNA_END=848 /DNA_ORIENTATION=+